jgi:hypothetical protein
MHSQEHIQWKLEQQLRYAEYKRQELVDQLNAMIDALEGRSAMRNPYRGFPINLLERGIHTGLDKIEKKFLRKIWKRMRERQSR